MVYNRLYDILPEVREEGSVAKLAERHNVTREAMRKLLESLDDGLASSLYTVLDTSSVVLSDVGLAYASACAKASRLFTQAELKAESIKRERENTIIIGTISKGVERLLKPLTECRVRTVFFDLMAPDAPSRLKSLGRDFDLALGIWDEAFLRRCRCKGISFGERRLAVALSSSDELSRRKRLDIEDLYGRRLCIPQHGHAKALDMLAGDLKAFHPHIELVECQHYNTTLFKDCAQDGSFILVSQDAELSAYGLKTLAVDWSYKAGYGLVYAQKASGRVEAIIRALEERLQ